MYFDDSSAIMIKLKIKREEYEDLTLICQQNSYAYKCIES
jgi:hypothetical protein